MSSVAAILVLCTAFLTAEEVNSFENADYATNRRFRIRGTVTSKCSARSIVLRDESGYIIAIPHNSKAIKTGDLIEVEGIAQIFSGNLPRITANRWKKIGTGSVPPITDATPEEISKGRADRRVVMTSGVVTDAFTDEIDPLCRFIIISSGGYSVICSLNSAVPSDFRSLIGARVTATGLVSPEFGKWRRFAGRGLTTVGEGFGIETVKPAPEDPFTAPMLKDPLLRLPREHYDSGRVCVKGRVTAVWNRDRFLIRSKDLYLPVLATMSRGLKAPAYGDFIKVAGFLDTDMFRIDLRNCLFRREDDDVRTEDEVPLTITGKSLFKDRYGRNQYNAPLYGQVVRISGIVRSIPQGDFDGRLMHLECDDVVIPVDVGPVSDALGEITIGCRVEVTGACLMKLDSGHHSSPLQRITGVTIVTRTPGDLKVVERPPWWTPGRLSVLVAILLAALAVTFAWNRILNRIITRRSGQLLKAQIAKASADLRVSERTRLAADIHDSLSQNLTGLACQLSAAERAIALRPETVKTQLETAQRMLLSSRTELKRCLLDLRGDALEDSDMNEAVRKTVAPIIGKAALHVDFRVPRSRLLDSTAHAVLCIVRELASNSIRHGKADKIEIRARCDGGTLVFSVRDDGAGFDPETCPGPAEGHFGLTGIRERVSRLGGSFRIVPGEKGKGIFAVISVKLAGISEREPDS